MKGEIFHMEQGSDEWFKAHIGIPTASQFGRIVTSRCEKSSGWNKYLAESVDRIVNGVYLDQSSGDWAQYGSMTERVARESYQFISGNTVSQVGFIKRDGIGCSPDGLVDDNDETIGLEIKCLHPKNHIEIIRGKKLPAAYFAQVQGSLYVTGLDYWDFFSYPATDDMRPFLIRVEPDEDYHRALDKFIPIFLEQMQELAEKVKI